jgi:hypothetical protein
MVPGATQPISSGPVVIKKINDLNMSGASTPDDKAKPIQIFEYPNFVAIFKSKAVEKYNKDNKIKLNFDQIEKNVTIQDSGAQKALQHGVSKAITAALSHFGKEFGTDIFEFKVPVSAKSEKTLPAHVDLTQKVRGKMAKLHRKANHLIRNPAGQEIPKTVDEIFSLIDEITSLTSTEQEYKGQKLTMEKLTHNHFQRECFIVLVNIMSRLPVISSPEILRLVSQNQKFFANPQNFTYMASMYLENVRVGNHDMQEGVKAAKGIKQAESSDVFSRKVRDSQTSMDLLSLYIEDPAKSSVKNGAEADGST